MSMVDNSKKLACCLMYTDYNVQHTPGPNLIIKDLPSVLILIIADQILNDFTNTTVVYVLTQVNNIFCF